MAFVALTLAAALLVASQSATEATLRDADPTCALTGEQLAANRLLSFQELDQTGVTAFTPRKLGERG